MEKLSYGQSRVKADSISKSADKLSDLLNRVDNMINKNVGSDDFWNGEDAQKYLDNYRKLSQNFPDFVQKVKDYATFIYGAVDAYEQTAKQGSQSAENLATGKVQ